MCELNHKQILNVWKGRFEIFLQALGLKKNLKEKKYSFQIRFAFRNLFLNIYIYLLMLKQPQMLFLDCIFNSSLCGGEKQLCSGH